MRFRIEEIIKKATLAIANGEQLPELTPTFLAQILYLKNKAFRQFDKLIPWVGGSEDLRVVLRQSDFQLSKENDSMFIWLQPYIHSMSLFLKLTNDNSVTAFIIDQQGWQWRYYPTRDIVYALVEYFGPNTKIILSNTSWQSLDIQTSCPLFTKIIGEYCIKYGDQLFTELSSLKLIKLADDPKITENSPEVAKLNVYRLQENVMPTGLEEFVEKELKKIAPKTSKEQSIWHEKTKTVRFEVTREAMQSYVTKSANICTEEQSYLYLNHLIEWQGLQAEMFLPAVMAEPIFDFKFIAPATLELSLHHKHRFYFGNAVLFSNNPMPNPEKNVLSDIFVNNEDITVTRDKKQFTVQFSAKNISTLYKAFSDLTRSEVQWQLFQQGLGHYQTLATALLGFEATETLKIREIQEVKTAGSDIDRINLALKYFLFDQKNISVLTDHYSLDDQEKEIPSQVLKAKATEVQYIVFSFAIDKSHQVLVIIDTKNEIIYQIDSQNSKDLSSIQALFNSSLFKDNFKKYKFHSLEPVALQKDDWTCGIHVVLNALNFFKLPAIITDYSDLTTATRKILRAAKQMESIVYKQKLAKITENKIIELLLKLLKEKKETCLWMAKLFDNLSTNYNENNFSIYYFIDNYEKKNDTCSEFLKIISSFLFIPQLSNDHNLLTVCVKNLINFSAKTIKPDQKIKIDILGAFSNAVIDSNSISRYEEQFKLEQSFIDFLSTEIVPEDISPYFDNFVDHTKETLSFYLCFSFADQLKELTKKQYASNRRLKAEIIRLQETENKFESKLQDTINLIFKNADINLQNVFAPVLKKQKLRLYLLTLEQWRELLIDFKTIPEKLNKVLENAEFFSKMDESLSFCEAIILSLFKLKLDKIAYSLQENKHFKKSIKPSFKEECIHKLLFLIKTENEEEFKKIFLNYSDKKEIFFNKTISFNNGSKEMFPLIEYANTLPTYEQFEFIKSKEKEIECHVETDSDYKKILQFLFTEVKFQKLFLLKQSNEFQNLKEIFCKLLNLQKLTESHHYRRTTHFILNDFSELILKENLEDSGEITIILHILPKSYKKTFLDSKKSFILSELTSTLLAEILEEIAPEERFDLIKEYQEEISIFGLRFLIDKVPEEKIFDLIDLKIKLFATDEDIKSILNYIPIHLSAAFFLRYQNLVSNIDLICYLFKDIQDINERIALIKEAISVLKLQVSYLDIYTILKYFPTEMAGAITIQLIEYISNNSDLFQFITSSGLFLDKGFLKNILYRFTQEDDYKEIIHIIVRSIIWGSNISIKSALQILNVISDPNTNSNTINYKTILNLILDNQFENIAIKYQSKIKTGQELFVITKLFSKKTRLNFAYANTDKIDDIDTLILFLSYIFPSELKFEITQKLTHVIKNTKDIKNVLSIIEKKLEFIFAQQDKLTTENEVMDIAQEITKCNKARHYDYFNFIFAKRELIKSEANIREISSKLLISHKFYKEELIKCANLIYKENSEPDDIKLLQLIFHKDFTQNLIDYLNQESGLNARIHKLSCILKFCEQFSNEFQLYIARKLAVIIPTGSFLSKILFSISFSNKQLFIEEQAEKIGDGYELASILNFVQKDNISFVTKLAHVIQDEEQLYAVVKNLDDNFRLKFIEENSEKIKSNDALIKFIKRLKNKEEKLSLVIALENKISSIDKLIKILQLFSYPDKKSIIKSSLRLVSSEEDMNKLLKIFGNIIEHEEVALILAQNAKDYQQLLYIIRIISPNKRFELISTSDTLKTGHHLAAFLGFLSQEQKLTLIEKLKPIITTIDEILYILIQFDINLRLQAAEILVDKLHNQEEVAKVRAILAPRDQAQFMQPEKPLFLMRKLKLLFFKESFVVNTQPNPDLNVNVTGLSNK